MKIYMKSINILIILNINSMWYIMAEIYVHNVNM